jgi:hypothetical protein
LGHEDTDKGSWNALGQSSCIKMYLSPSSGERE